MLTAPGLLLPRRTKTGNAAPGDIWGGLFDPNHAEPYVSWVSNVRRVLCDQKAPLNMHNGSVHVKGTWETWVDKPGPEVVGQPVSLPPAARLEPPTPPGLPPPVPPAPLPPQPPPVAPARPPKVRPKAPQDGSTSSSGSTTPESSGIGSGANHTVEVGLGASTSNVKGLNSDVLLIIVPSRHPRGSVAGNSAAAGHAAGAPGTLLGLLLLAVMVL